MVRFTFVAALLSAIVPLHAQDAEYASDLEPLFTVEGITEYRLDNGLRVLLFPDPSKQKVTVNVTYMVGSRHEGRGEKGMAHLLEHMVFKGTDTFENIWGALEDHGANFNGTTWLDRTNYFETLPATDENLDFALRMEADRMVNSRIAADELAKEFSVVRNEFEMGENNPVGVLMDRLVSTAYLWHNYGFSTIGNRSDIERVPVGNLRAFYEKYYQPDNAMLVVAGKFEEQATLGLIEKYFGTIRRPERRLEDTYTEEPTQDGARFVSLSRVASNQATGAVYHIPAGSHPDAAPLNVLMDMLTSEPSGRVYEALVPDLASNVFSFTFPTKEPGIALVMAMSRVDQDVQKAHDTLLATVEGLAAEGVTDEEVERSKTKLLKGIRLALKDAGRIGVELSEWQALGDWRLFFLHRDQVKAVTAADVRRVAGQYFIESNRTSGIFRPTSEPERAEIPAAPDVAALVEGYEGSETVAAGEAFEPTPENVERRTKRLTIGDGIQVAILPKETRGDSVVASFAFHFGTEATLQGKETAFTFIPELLMRGTKRLDYQALEDEIDRLQSRINVSGGAGVVRASIESDRANFANSIRLLAEILKSPAFPKDEFDVIKEQRMAGIETNLTDPQPLVFNLLQRLLHPFPPESIHYVPTLEEELVRTREVELDQLKELYGNYYGADHGQISIVGDFDVDETLALLASELEEWKSKAEYQRITVPYAAIQGTDETILTPDKSMAVVVRGAVLQLNDSDPDFATLDFANYVLGESAKSRLLNRLRHQGGMSYGAGSRLQVDAKDESGGLFGYAICAPENAGKVQEAMREEFQKWIENGITKEELVEGKQGYTQGFEGQMANDRFIARQLLDGLENDRTFEYQAALLKRIESLTLEDVSKTLEARLSEAAFVDVKGGDLEKN